ncbi:MAG: hypothetical protein C0626_11540 [Arcobacter sp.]|nr:MAG: hypothetical protein C0626_11540 [Arcobacter sp.]
MKKFVKLSLVAAVAVAGLTTANAKPLEEAIKDVDVSGTVVYRYDDRNNDVGGASAVNNNYKIGLNLKSKVNDDVTANFRIITATGINTNQSFAGLDTASNDANPSLNLSQVNFAYTGIANTTVIVGKQGLTTPWTVAADSDSNEQTGTGILALSTVGPVTIAGAYFNQTNLGVSGDDIATVNALSSYANGGGNNVATVGVMANVGPVSLDAWYLDMADVFDSYTLGAKASFDLDAVTLGADLRYTALSVDSQTGQASNADDHDLVKLTLTAKAGIVDAKLAFAKTDKEGGLVALDDDATTTIQGWMVNPTNKADATFVQASVGVQAMDSVHVSANYTEVESRAVGATVDTEEEEVYAKLTYKMSKNLSSYVRFGQYESKPTNGAKTNDDTRGRLQVQYSF